MYIIDFSISALEDLRNIKFYLEENYGESVALGKIREISRRVRRLEQFPLTGVSLSNLVKSSLNYRYLVVEKNYVFYRIDNNRIKIIRILNERQGFIKLLF